MTFLPIVGRELRVLASRTRVHWVRAALAGFAVLACLQWVNFKLTAPNAATIGLETFHMLAWLGFVLALGAAMVTADCVSHERREGTLGLLFLTTLKSHDVVLGKFAAMGTVAIYALLGFAPVLMVPLMIGGVTGGEVVRVALVLLNILFVSLATGLWVSVYARSQFGAILTAFAALGFLALAPFFVGVVGKGLIGFPFSIFSPVLGYFLSPDAVFKANPAPFWWSLGVTNLEGWGLIVAATFGLRRNWRAVQAGQVVRLAPAPQSRRLVGAPRVVVCARGQGRRTFAPVARALLRMKGLPEMAWFAAVVSLVGSLANAVVMNRLGSVWGAATISIVFTFASSALFALVGGRFLFEARRSGELELLLVTPVGARGILREQRLALQRILRKPIYVVVLGAIAVAAGSIRAFEGREMVGLLFGLCHLANTALGVLAVSWVGMWFATRVNSAFGILGWTVGLVEVAPIALAYLLPVLFGTPRVYEFWPLVVLLLLAFKNLFFIRWAEVRLRAEFRTKDRIVADGYGRRFLATLTGRVPEPQPQLAP